ncbi:hypothetical protein [Endozoicomonas sp. 8E]|uniref:hypothetical protein n=1 Tax=Endozoicomonas sp. 8E TaxID=3035692 RepID=UPI0029392C85|nr:hypothetical protein [Endozoicomonas sp. 8E]WOG29575.1 hypothetical protein P6910_07965 [Endozoicomonas sp. 8E]
MTVARPNVLSLAVALAISSSIIGTQALAECRLLTKSIDIVKNGQVEFTRSEVRVQPTLGEDGQPIPKSFTTTYPDQTPTREGYIVPSDGFTNILSAISADVSSIDLFETGANEVAQKYTKVLKVGDEEVFRFTHSLNEKKLVIEVRGGMTDQDTVETVRDRFPGIEALEPLTKIAGPEGLANVLEAANIRAGKLGTSDHYVPLATIEVEAVEVNRRTFMRPVVAGNQPPELHRLGQSLFVNDDVLLAAATSAYIQVHVLQEDLQQKALNELLAQSKPVGYVVHVEDDTQVYPVPAGYPKLEVAEAPGEVIVFHGQMQSPDDVAFVESLYKSWAEAEANNLTPAVWVNKHKVKSYQYVIRSRQMTMLEKIAAQHDADLDESQLITLAYYESLQQALTSAASDQADGFQFALEHFRIASSVMTPTWLKIQLSEHFSFKPALGNLLTNQHFVQDILNTIPVYSHLMTDFFYDDEQFAAKVLSDMAKEHIKMDSRREQLQTIEAKLFQLKSQLQRETERADASAKEKQKAQSPYWEAENKLEKLEETIDRTPCHPKTRPEVLNKLKAVERALEDNRLSYEDDVYLHRQIISEDIQKYIREAREHSEEEALNILEAIEKIFNIEINEGDDKAARLERIHKRLDGPAVSAYDLDKMDKILWQDFSTAPEDLEGRDVRLNSIHARLTFKVEEWEQQAKEQQTYYLSSVEDELEIYPYKSDAAIEKGKALTARLANVLQVEFEKDLSLSGKKHLLLAKAWALTDEVSEVYENESIKRDRNNEIAHQLNIEDYQDHATIDDQVSLIKEKLTQLRKAVLGAGKLDLNERIAAVEDELDKQMARLGSKPRYALDRELATARRLLKEAESELETAHQKLDVMRVKQLVFTGTRAYLRRISQQPALNTIEEAVDLETDATDTNGQPVNAVRNRQAQPDSDDGTGGKMSQQLTQEKTRLEAEVEARKADVERIKEVLKSAEEAVENNGGPFQFTPGQEKVRADMHAFVQQHPLRKQALEAAMGLAQSAVKSGKAIPWLGSFDFDNELAPVRLQALVGDELTFDQASRIVAVFRNLRTRFPEPSHELTEDQSQNILEKVQSLVQRARNEIQKGPQQYDEEIHSMGNTAIHYFDHKPGDLQSFPEYFATHSATGNRIMALLHEGLISKVELENYIKAIRRADNYKTVDEFEHFLGYKHGTKLTHFKAAVRMLSDKGVKKFIESALTPVTAAGPTGMKESVTGMKEFAAAVIANYVLDDIAFDNGRRTAAFLANVQDTLTPYANAAGISESELIQTVHDTLMQAHAAAVEQQLKDCWVKPSAFLVQAVTWYYSSYKPLLVTQSARQAVELSLSNMSFLYLLDLINRGDYTHRILTPFQHWMERFGVDLDRTGQYACHSAVEQVSEVGGLAMPLGKAASSVILLKTGSMLFARQRNANPYRYRSISRLVPEIVKSMGSGQGVQVPLVHRVTPQKVKHLASATAGLVLGPVATVGAYAHGLLSGFTYAQTFGFALASSLTFDFFMNDNKMLTHWLGGPLGRSIDRINRWRGIGETNDEYVERSAIATPQRFSETDEEYANRVKANNTMHGWTRHENYLQFRERRDRTMKLFDNGWEKYFRENVPKWSFSHAESIPYSYTLDALFEVVE